jgi:hypothetical protein
VAVSHPDCRAVLTVIDALHATVRTRLTTSLSTWIPCSSRSLNAVHPKHALPATMPWQGG